MCHGGAYIWCCPAPNTGWTCTPRVHISPGRRGRIPGISWPPDACWGYIQYPQTPRVYPVYRGSCVTASLAVPTFLNADQHVPARAALWGRAARRPSYIVLLLQRLPRVPDHRRFVRRPYCYCLLPREAACACVLSGRPTVGCGRAGVGCETLVWRSWWGSITGVVVLVAASPSVLAYIPAATDSSPPAPRPASSAYTTQRPVAPPAAGVGVRAAARCSPRVAAGLYTGHRPVLRIHTGDDDDSRGAGGAYRHYY